MTRAAENPPAFPASIAVTPTGDEYHGCDGMSLRDWFAGQALAGLLAGRYRETCDHNLSEVPDEAYAIADALLAARGDGQ